MTPTRDEKKYRQLQIWTITWTLLPLRRGRPKKSRLKDFPDPESQKRFYNQMTQRWCFQKEKGLKGNLHYQIQIDLKKKSTQQAFLRSFVEFFNLSEKEKEFLYIRPTSNVGEKAAFSYSMKTDTRVGEFYCDSSYYAGKDLYMLATPRPFSEEDYFFVGRRAGFPQDNVYLRRGREYGEIEISEIFVVSPRRFRLNTF